MHENENEMNSNAYHNATMTNCITPTDSVNNGNEAENHQRHYRATTTTTTTTTNNNNATPTAKIISTENLNQEYKPFNKNDKHTNNFNIENLINITRQQNNNSELTNDRVNDRGKPYAVSPTVSVRSTTISIVSIDANAIDSSVVDSDSEYEADAEGVHSHYVVKKLGQQTTYAPDSPDIPTINKGLQVVSQTVNPTGSSNLPPDAISAQLINGGFARPNALDNNNSMSQIGSIALTNSTDVTFGDKHFYEGPVTIQQFLIDSRDKWKPIDGEGQDNPIYTADDKDYENDAAAKVNATSTQDLPYKFIFNRKAVLFTGVIILLTILLGILIVVVKPSIGKNSDADNDAIANGTLVFVERKEWGARDVKNILTKLELPVHRAIISHTATDLCYTKDICIMRMQVAQNFHMDSLGWDDIGYNFLIGCDGRVYVGRGWNDQGAHTKGYNVDSIGISFIGTYTKTKPTAQQVTAGQLLLDEGVRLKKLVPDYRLYGHRQLSGTESPGDALYAIIQTWPHWAMEV